MQSKIQKNITVAFLFFLVLFFPTVHLKACQAFSKSELTGKVDELFKEWDKIDSPGAALGIFKDGKIIYSRGYGMANLDYNIPITPQSVFRTGSVSKQFTAMCIAMLVEQGKISLDDDVRKYLPEMAEFDPPVTIRHMIHHTSGIRDYLVLQGLAGRSGGYFYTSPEVVDLLARQRGLDFKPGGEYSYSNSGYFLLAEIVGRVSGMKTSEFAKKHIFEPLGMKNTHFHDDPAMVVKNRASGYMPQDGGGFRIHMTQLDMIGDGSIFTTIDDFFKWDQNFYANKLGQGTQDMIALMLTPGKLNDGQDLDYAFGLEVSHYRGLETIGHSGSFVGYQAHYLRFPEQRFSVVILSNLGTTDPGSIAWRIAELYLADLFTEPPDSRGQNAQQKIQETGPEPMVPSSEQLEEYAGKYYSDELGAMAFLQIEHKRLILKLGRDKSELVPIAADAFSGMYVSDDAYNLEKRHIKFTRDKESRIFGFLMCADPIKNLRFKKAR